MEIAIRTKKFDVFFTCFKSLMENYYIGDKKIRIIVSTMRNPEKYPEKKNLTPDIFLRDQLLFREFARSIGAKLEFIYIDDIKDRLPGNKNIFPYAIYRSLINSKHEEVLSLDDDIYHLRPGLFDKLSEIFSEKQSALGVFNIYKANIKKWFPHSCFIYAKNVKIESTYFIDPIECHVEYGDADAAKFLTHPNYFCLNEYFNFTHNYETVKNEFFQHVDSVTIKLNWLLTDILEKTGVRIDSSFPAAIGEVTDNNRIIDFWENDNFIYK